jgi:hypothetical protein
MEADGAFSDVTALLAAAVSDGAIATFSVSRDAWRADVAARAVSLFEVVGRAAEPETALRNSPREVLLALEHVLNIGAPLNVANRVNALRSAELRTAHGALHVAAALAVAHAAVQRGAAAPRPLRAGTLAAIARTATAAGESALLLGALALAPDASDGGGAVADAGGRSRASPSAFAAAAWEAAADALLDFARALPCCASPASGVSSLPHTSGSAAPASSACLAALRLTVIVARGALALPGAEAPADVVALRTRMLRAFARVITSERFALDVQPALASSAAALRGERLRHARRGAADAAAGDTSGSKAPRACFAVHDLITAAFADEDGGSGETAAEVDAARAELGALVLALFAADAGAAPALPDSPAATPALPDSPAATPALPDSPAAAPALPGSPAAAPALPGSPAAEPGGSHSGSGDSSAAFSAVPRVLRAAPLLADALPAWMPLLRLAADSAARGASVRHDVSPSGAGGGATLLRAPGSEEMELEGEDEDEGGEDENDKT